MSRTCPELIITKNERGEMVERPCGRQLLEGSDRCIFHDPYAWRTHAELMRKEIREKIENGDLNFHKYHLPEIDFSAITKEFKELVDFREAVFHRNVRFDDVTFFNSVSFYFGEFSGNVWFSDAKFSKGAEFSHAKFSGTAWFDNAKFSGDAWFVGAKFSGGAWFGGSEFSGNALFIGAKFSGRQAGFDDAKFSGDALFIGSKFSDETGFVGAEFSGKAEFDFSRFCEIVEFNGLIMSDVQFTFRKTLFERGVSVDEHLWSKSGFRLLIEESDLASAVDSYQALRRGFENMGHYRVAGELFYREMTCRKNMIPLSMTITHSDTIILPKWLRSLIQTAMRSKPLRLLFNKMELLLKVRVRWRAKLIDWLWMRMFDVTCGFGERPKRVVLGAILTVLTFAGLYFPIVNSTDNLGRFQTAFLLSLDAFTPGKFLNIPFTSPGEWLVQIETVLGWFMLSLFLVVFVRKMSRG